MSRGETPTASSCCKIDGPQSISRFSLPSRTKYAALLPPRAGIAALAPRNDDFNHAMAVDAWFSSRYPVGCAEMPVPGALHDVVPV